MKVTFDGGSDAFIGINIVVLCLSGMIVSFKNGRKNDNDIVGTEPVTFSVEV